MPEETETKKRTQYHVVPFKTTKSLGSEEREDIQWKVEITDGECTGVYLLKQYAIDDAVRLAKANQPSQVIIHGEDGKIQDERTYGNDPHPPRG